MSWRDQLPETLRPVFDTAVKSLHEMGIDGPGAEMMVCIVIATQMAYAGLTVAPFAVALVRHPCEDYNLAGK